MARWRFSRLLLFLVLSLYLSIIPPTFEGADETEEAETTTPSGVGFCALGATPLVNSLSVMPHGGGGDISPRLVPSSLA